MSNYLDKLVKTFNMYISFNPTQVEVNPNQEIDNLKFEIKVDKFLH